MCLAVPMQVLSTDGYMSTCGAMGVEREVSLFMMQDEILHPGDFVLVHVGYAIQKVSKQEAMTSWNLFDEILSANA